VNFILLASAQIKLHKDENENTAASLGNESSFLARLALRTDSPHTEEDATSNVGR
jgi:hypothetical protein